MKAIQSGGTPALVLSLLVALASLTGCVGGGRQIKNGDAIAGARTIAVYRSSQTTSAMATYHLLNTPNGLACMVVDSEGNRTLATSHWIDSEGDHFAMWIELFSTQGHAFEMVFPKDRNRKGSHYIYPPDAYAILIIGGERRPAPTRREAHFVSELRRIHQ